MVFDRNISFSTLNLKKDYIEALCHFMVKAPTDVPAGEQVEQM